MYKVHNIRKINFAFHDRICQKSGGDFKIDKTRGKGLNSRMERFRAEH